MNLCIAPVPESGGAKHNIYKHFVFAEKMPQSDAVLVAHGTALLVKFGANKRAGAKPFVYMWQRMKGLQFSYMKIGVGMRAEKPLESSEAIDAGYDHIKKYLPTKVTNNARNRWIDKELNTSDSPIYGWQLSRVKQAVLNIKETGQHAKPSQIPPFQT